MGFYFGGRQQEFLRQLEDLQRRFEALAESRSLRLEDEADAWKHELAMKEKELAEKEKVLEQREKLLAEQERSLQENLASSQDAVKPENEAEVEMEITPANVWKKLAELEKLIGETSYKDKIIKDLHEEVQKYNRDLQSELAKPLLKNIIKIHEHIAKTLRYFMKEEKKTMPDAFALLLKEVNGNLYMVQDLLEDDYDLVYFEPSVGDMYMPKEQKALQSLPTQDEQLVGTVAETLCGGFKDSKNGKIFKQAVVSVYVQDKND